MSKTNTFKLWVVVVSFIITIMSVAIYYGLNLTVPQFKEVFASFDTDLPAITELFVNYHQSFIYLALLGVIPTFLLLFQKSFKPKAVNILFGIVILSFSISVLIQMLAIISMYLPVIR